MERLNEVVSFQRERAEIRDGRDNEDACRSGDQSGHHTRQGTGPGLGRCRHSQARLAESDDAVERESAAEGGGRRVPGRAGDQSRPCERADDDTKHHAPEAAQQSAEAGSGEELPEIRHK